MSEPTRDQIRAAWLVLLASLIGIVLLLWAAWASVEGV